MSRPRALKNDPEAQEAAKAFANLDAKKARDANDAIAILERRANRSTRDVQLPGGDVVPIRYRISKAAMARCSQCFNGIGAAREAGDAALVEEFSNQLVGEILYVPDMTPAEIAAWLAENPESFSDLDAAEIVVSFGEMLKEENERIGRVSSFRQE